ncbi:PEP/pyruvate-binding domain-containing protein [Thermosulfuriphilus sp.]
MKNPPESCPPGREIPLESDALRVNLQETAVESVCIQPRFEVLREVVADYQGLRKQVDHLLFELHHPYRNWRIILPELRSFALKNFKIYGLHPRGAEASAAIADVFIDLILEAKEEDIKAQAVDALWAYLEKIVEVLPEGRLHDYLPFLNYIFGRLNAIPDETFISLIQSYHSLKRLGRGLLKKLPAEAGLENLARLIYRGLVLTYEFWLKGPDPLAWFAAQCRGTCPREDASRIFAPIAHETLRRHLAVLEAFPYALSSRAALERLLEFPDFIDIIRNYKEVAHYLEELTQGLEADDPLRNCHILFLFHVLEIKGLASIHEETLREVNRILVSMVRREPPARLEEFIVRSFGLLRENVGEYPHTALECLRALGHEIFDRASPHLVELFLEQVVKFGFQPPKIQGVDIEWHVICNPAHLLNIRIWLDLICRNPKWCTTLLSALIINLKLAGTCIRDTDLFQKDITKLLNSEIGPVYNLVKQFCRILPVYFNEIGAEGLLRDVSTELDELTRRRDILVHFLRKQSHVESSNLIVDFIEEIIYFWLTKDKKGLSRYVPSEVFEEISSSGPFIDEVHQLTQRLFKAFSLRVPQDLLRLPEEDLETFVSSQDDISERERKRLALLIKMYRLENLKYKLGVEEIFYHLEQAKRWGFERLDELITVLREDRDPATCLEAILDYLAYLKEIILSPEKFEAREDIYHKRHIAADIPSMYGRYHERKFDALGLSFRLENLANIYFERLIETIDIPFVTRATFYKILKCLRFFQRALELEGINSKKFNTYITLLEKSLEIRRFTFTQYVDIVRGLSEGVKDIIKVYYVSPHRENLGIIIRQLGRENLLPKYLLGADKLCDRELFHRISESFLRDQIASAFGLQYLDNFVSRIYHTILEQREGLSPEDLDLLLSYDPGRVICFIHQPNPLTEDLIHLGNKGYNLYLLAREGIRVPRGFIITTEVFRCYRIIQLSVKAHEDFIAQIKEGIYRLEKETGRIFGSPENPLLLSVRSGAAISMPGMMATLLNVGSNPNIIEGLAQKTGQVWYAWDTYRRFVQSWGMAFGMEREIFNSLMRSHKEHYRVAKKREFTGEQMRELALLYRQTVLDYGLEIADDPWEQLLVAIRLVLGSWDSPKARAYRQIMGISDNWGTAVIVQCMTFGNLSRQSGTGVLFTAPPFGKLSRVVLWGDYTPGNQGEDIVSGLVTTYPISIEQKKREGREDELALEEAFPEIYRALYRIAQELVYRKKWSPQEIEFTFEGPEADKLFILQSRDMVTKEDRERVPVFVPSERLEASFMARGIGVNGGALSGLAVFSLEDIKELRFREPETPLILIRSDTVPDDIQEISLTDGLLTAKGGQTSHAAIVAARLGKTCVVGCQPMVVVEQKGYCRFNGHIVKKGDWISIDGVRGRVYLGRHPIQEEVKFALQ